jgi:hypothetical protein
MEYLSGVSAPTSSQVIAALAGQALGVSRITLSGNISAPAWTTAGIGIAVSPRTITDTSSSGAVAAAYTNVLGGNTIAASNTTTFTNYCSVYFLSPVAGTNVTITNPYALGLGGPQLIEKGTITASRPSVQTETWNSGGVTFLSSVINVTNTASATASCFVDYQVAASPVYSVRRDGAIVLGRGTASEIVISRTNSNQALNINAPNNGQIGFWGLSNPSWNLTLPGYFNLGFSSNTLPANGVGDCYMARDEADGWAQRRGTSAQTFRVYNTYTDLSNYERNTINWASNVCYQRNQNAGTGSARLFVPVTGATTVAGLPSASTAGAGARSMVTDANATTFQSIVAGGGSNAVPVYSDGTDWRIG